MNKAARRSRLRPWLEEQIQSGKYPGVSWLDQSAQVFQIPWRHAARHGWSIDQDATLFMSWAMHTGRYRPGRDQPDPKTWKANFRCALNSLRDVCELPEQSRKKGNNASRVYRMLPRTHTHTRNRGKRTPARLRPRPMSASGEAGGDARCHHAAHTAHPTHTPQPSPTHTLDSTNTKLGKEGPWVDSPVDYACGNARTHGLWETRQEEQEQSEAVYKLMDLGSAELWNQSAEQRGWRAHTLRDHWNCDGEDYLNSVYSDSFMLWTENDDSAAQCCNKELSVWPKAQWATTP